MEAYKFVETLQDSIFIGKKISYEFYKNAISLPSSANLKKSDQDFIINTLKEILKNR